MDDRVERAQRVRELEQAAEHRREADGERTMAERLARLNDLCRQASAIAGAARPSS